MCRHDDEQNRCLLVARQRLPVVATGACRSRTVLRHARVHGNSPAPQRLESAPINGGDVLLCEGRLPVSRDGDGAMRDSFRAGRLGFISLGAPHTSHCHQSPNTALSTSSFAAPSLYILGRRLAILLVAAFISLVGVFVPPCRPPCRSSAESPCTLPPFFFLVAILTNSMSPP